MYTDSNPSPRGGSPSNQSPHSHQPSPPYDYGAIEDKAGVEYTYALIVTVIYIGLHLQLRHFFPEPLWIILTTGLSIASWWYFRAYFKAVGDHSTAKWINLIIGSMALFGFTNFFMYTNADIIEVILTGEREGWSFIGTVFELLHYSVFASIIAIFLFSFKLLAANSRHPFPLKRIALSTMFLLPLYMVVSLILNAHFFWQFLYFLALIFGDGTSDRPTMGFWSHMIFMVPYFCLAYFFYRANKDDRTA